MRDLFKQIEEQENRAREFGFYWEHIDQLMKQIQSECLEIKEAWQTQNRAHIEEEIGDLLQAVIGLAIFCKIDPDQALYKSFKKFQKRYDAVVALVQQDGYENLRQQPMDVLLHYWKKAKSIQ